MEFPSSDYILWPAQNPPNMQFVGCCMVESANPAATHSDALTMTSGHASATATTTIYPSAGSDQALLLKLTSPVVARESATHVLIDQVISASATLAGVAPPWASGRVKYTFKYSLITSDFDYTGPSCAVWNDGLQNGEVAVEGYVRASMPDQFATTNPKLRPQAGAGIGGVFVNAPTSATLIYGIAIGAKQWETLSAGGGATSCRATVTVAAMPQGLVANKP